MLKEIAGSLADGDDENAVRIAILRIRRDHQLSENPNTPVEDQGRLLVDVRGLKYQERLAMQEAATPSEPAEAAGKASNRPRSPGMARARTESARTAVRMKPTQEAAE
jgi:hypothetical protein